MKYQILIVFILGLILQSCAFYGLTNDYSKLDIEQQKIIEKFDLSEEVKTNHIYEISATQLKEELKNHKKSIVYLFANGCSSKYCLPLNVYVNYARSEEHTSELQSRPHLVCRLLLEKKKKKNRYI